MRVERLDILHLFLTLMLFLLLNANITYFADWTDRITSKTSIDVKELNNLSINNDCSHKKNAQKIHKMCTTNTKNTFRRFVFCFCIVLYCIVLICMRYSCSRNFESWILMKKSTKLTVLVRSLQPFRASKQSICCPLLSFTIRYHIGCQNHVKLKNH